MLKNSKLRAAMVVATILTSCPALAEEPMSLKAGFENPPQSARPRVWWHWMNGNVTIDGIDKDLAWMERVGIGGAQVWALNVIQHQPGVSVNELARAMDIHQSTASNLIRQLVKRELVRTEKSEHDRRSVKIFIESAGLDLLKRVSGPYEGVLPDALKRLPPETIAQLNRNLGELIDVLQADEDAAQTPLADL